MKQSIAGGLLLSSPTWYVPSTNQQLLKDLPPMEKASRLPCHIVSAYQMAQTFIDQIQALSPEIQLHHRLNDDPAHELLSKADVYVGRLSPEDFSRTKNLKWIHSTSAGVEKQLFPEMVASNVIVTNAKGCYAPAIADHVIGMLLTLARQISGQIRQMPKHKWGGTGDQLEMTDMTMGIVGFGGIGRQVARRAKALDMRVIAADIQAYYPAQIGDLCEDLYHAEDEGLRTLLQESDVVVCGAPHTSRSEGMFGATQFADMKSGSFFINVSRGKLVDTPALVDAIRSGHLQGVALDVTDPEPLPPDHVLWDFENVIITSHISGRSQYSRNRVQSVLTDNVHRYLNGYPLINLVDKVAGF